MTRAESIRRANQFFQDSLQNFQYGYDSIITSANAFGFEAGNEASKRHLATPVLDWKRPGTAPKEKVTDIENMRAKHPAGWNAGVKRQHVVGPERKPSWNAGAGGGGMKDITTRDTNSPQQKHHEAWLPAGMTEMEVSQNRLINQNKVESVARRHWMQAPYNHFNKLHSPEREVSRSRSPSSRLSPRKLANETVIFARTSRRASTRGSSTPLLRPWRR